MPNIRPNLPQMHKGTDRGYTLLFSVLVAALALGVAAFILSVSVKQFELSVSARDSMYSFYAADTGIECAAEAYYNGTLATSSNGVASPASVTCNNQTLSSNFQTLGSGFPSVFSNAVYPVYQSLSSNQSNLNFGLPGTACVDLVVYDGYDANNVHWTIVDSRGYNHCNTSAPNINKPNTSLPNVVERALRLGKQG